MVKIHFLANLMVALPLLSACQPNQNQISNDDIPRDVVAVIAACSAGIEIEDSVSAELGIELASILEGEGSLDAKAAIASSIRGLVFPAEVLNDPEGQKSYQNYTNCVTEKFTLSAER